MVSGFSGETPEVGACRAASPDAPATQNEFKDTNGVICTAAWALAAAPTPLVPVATTLSENGAWLVPTSFGPALIVHPAAMLPPETAHDATSEPVVGDDHFRATDVPPQLPPETVTGWVFVALVNATEFGLTVMNGVGVIVSVSRTPPPPDVQFKGTTVGAVAPGALTSSVRLSGDVVETAGSDTVTVPLAAAVRVPTWLPARITTGAAG